MGEGLVDEETLLKKFQSTEEAKALSEQALQFGDGIAELLRREGELNEEARKFYRLLVEEIELNPVV